MTRTLADMTPAERADCVGMWCERRDTDMAIISDVEDKAAVVTFPKGGWRWDKLPDITPRMDLPRAWTPSGEPAPGEWEEKIYQDGIGDYIRFTRQRRYITDWEVPHESR